MEKSNSQRLKKSKKFAFGNSQFTKQHNISLSGAINKDKIVYTSDQTSDHHQLGGRRVGLRKKKVRWNNGQQFPWTKNVVSRTATLPTRRSRVQAPAWSRVELSATFFRHIVCGQGR